MALTVILQPIRRIRTGPRVTPRRLTFEDDLHRELLAGAGDGEGSRHIALVVGAGDFDARRATHRHRVILRP